MKVKIIKTGEIVEVVPAKYVGQVEDAYSKRHWSFNEIEVIPDNIKQETIIDWEQRRFELVKAVTQGLSTVNGERGGLPIDIIAKLSIDIADAVIAKLKENN